MSVCLSTCLSVCLSVYLCVNQDRHRPVSNLGTVVISEGAVAVHKVFKLRPVEVQDVERTSNKWCLHCGKRIHDSQQCQFEHASCFECGKKGHIATVCPSQKPTKQQISKRMHQMVEIPDVSELDTVKEATNSSDKDLF